MKTPQPLTPELAEIAEHLGGVAKKAGLDCFQTIFEVVDYNQLNEIAAYGGFPTRYPHWRFGMEYEQLSKSYTYGLSKIYEMVINNDPCYAYLLKANDLMSQKMVMAHVYGHCDFFKNNLWFSKTNRKMLDQMANHSAFVNKFIDELGHDVVEDFIDSALSLENLIDPYSVFKKSTKNREQILEQNKTKSSRIASKGYMDKYVNPAEFLEQQEAQRAREQAVEKGFPAEPQRDVLNFLIEHAPLESWQKKIVEIIRDEAYYFAPQAQTKILNEGWASFWHSETMTKLAPLSAAEMIDYCDNHAGVVSAAPGSLNPYKLGIELLRHVEDRWNKGKYGADYHSIDSPVERKNWDKQTGLGRDKIFEIRKTHNDITFLSEYLDEDFCHESKMFIYDYDAQNRRYVISSRDFKGIKNQLLKQLTNFGQPIINLTDANFGNRSELLLKHVHDGDDLKVDYAFQTLKNLYKIWTRPVHIETIMDGEVKRFSFDGQNELQQKVK